jgi:hypothetical protein
VVDVVAGDVVEDGGGSAWPDGALVAGRLVGDEVAGSVLVYARASVVSAARDATNDRPVTS